MNRNEVLALLSAETEVLRQHFGVQHLSLFGSVAREDHDESSDADFLVEFEGPASFDSYMGLKFYLEELLKMKVDLVTSKGLRAGLQERVRQEAIRVA